MSAVTCNVGGADRAIRIALGVALAAFAFLSNVDTVWKVIMGVVAAIALVTATIGYCPLNSLLGINSCRHKS